MPIRSQPIFGNAATHGLRQSLIELLLVAAVVSKRLDLFGTTMRQMGSFNLGAGRYNCIAILVTVSNDQLVVIVMVELYY